MKTVVLSTTDLAELDAMRNEIVRDLKAARGKALSMANNTGHRSGPYFGEKIITGEHRLELIGRLLSL